MHKSCIRCLLVATAISAGSLSLAAAPSALSSRAFGDDTKKEKKEEDKYTKFFKDKKVETPAGSSLPSTRSMVASTSSSPRSTSARS